MLGHYAEVRHQKKIGFQIVIFSLFLVPTLITLFGISYNGLADNMPSREIEAVIVDKWIHISKGGGTPHVKLSVIEENQRVLDRPLEKEISKALFEEIRVGDTMIISINPGALGIPWIKEWTPS